MFLWLMLIISHSKLIKVSSPVKNNFKFTALNEGSKAFK